MGESVSLLREPDAIVSPVRFDERDVETEHGRTNEAPAKRKSRKQIGPTYTTAPHLDSTLGVPDGIRTRVTAVKGRCPRPLDDGDMSRV